MAYYQNLDLIIKENFCVWPVTSVTRDLCMLLSEEREREIKNA